MDVPQNCSIAENKCVILDDKNAIYLSDDDDFSLSIVSNGKVLFSIPIAYPSAGYGGGTLCLSPSHSYLLFSYYSGQSQEAFTLFKIADNKLEIVYESPYLYGEVAAYTFFDDEKTLIQGLFDSTSIWELTDYMEQGCAEKDDDENLFFSFGQLNVLDIAKKMLNKHPIRIYPSEETGSFSDGEITYFMLPEMIGADTLKISTPWGDRTFSWPLEDILSLHTEK